MVIVENFKAHCQPKIGGLAKAMIVASSMIQAFRYKQEMNNEGMIDLLHIY
jgi:hypothetical protein